MDDTDLRILLKLMANCRIPQREIAADLALSVTAVNKRLAMLTEKVIQDFVAGLHFAVVPAQPALIYGQAPGTVDAEMLDRLGDSDQVYRAIIASGNQVYMTCHLKNLDKIEEVSEHFSSVTGIDGPVIGLINQVIPKHYSSSLEGGSLARIDYRIMQAMRTHARASHKEIANTVGTSAKTVKRRLEKLISTNSIQLSVELASSGEMFTIYHITLDSLDRKTALVHRLINHYRPRVFEVGTMKTRPKDMYCQAWAPDFQAVNDLQAKLAAEPGITNVVPNILMTGKSFPTWRDSLLDGLARTG